MSSIMGEKLKVSIFGQSHGEAIGVVMDNLPAGEHIDFLNLQEFLNRRSPGENNLSTARKEDDIMQILSGVVDGITCGAPFCAIIPNQDVRSSDYRELVSLPRPSHADYPAQIKHMGHQDHRGGGHFSGRLTAPICIAGGIAKQILEKRNIYIGAHVQSVGTIQDKKYTTVDLGKKELFSSLEHELPVIEPACIPAIKKEIEDAKRDLDSIGGIIECACIGLPPGIGDPMFDGMENKISSAIFGIPAIRGIEFGSGFESATMRGSQNNDPYTIIDETIVTKTNHHGGILGGITTAMPLIFRVAIKPTPSIAQEQDTVNMATLKPEKLYIKGRHDPCIALRAVPVVEAITALVILDSILMAKGNI